MTDITPMANFPSKQHQLPGGSDAIVLNAIRPKTACCTNFGPTPSGTASQTLQDIKFSFFSGGGGLLLK